jgi:hypothetical protein
LSILAAYVSAFADLLTARRSCDLDAWMTGVDSDDLPALQGFVHGLRMDLLGMEAHGQDIYDTADPRHPLRWFGRDDLREQCASSLAYVRMSQDEQAAHTKEAMARLNKYLTAESA